MKKVMLVDDEIVVRENISACLEWEKEGFFYCGDAPDGEMALPLIEKWKPDILITDIKMPFMNGLELSEIVRQRLPDTKIVILSGHDEFTYARSALRLGVEEYCLKPVSAADLIELLRNISDKIDRERREQQMSRYTREKLFRDLCGGLLPAAEALVHSAALSLPLSARCYAVIVWGLRFQDASTQYDPQTAANLSTLLEERLAELGEDWCFKKSRSESVFILRGDSPEELRKRLDHLQTAVLPALEKELSCPITIGVGSIQERLQNIHVSFVEAEEDFSLRRFSARGNQVWSRIAQGAPDTTLILDRAKFIEFLKIGTQSQTEAFFQDFATGIQSEQWQSSFYLCYLLNELTLETLRLAKRMFRLETETELRFAELQKEIDKVTGREQFCRYLIGLLELFWQWRSEATDKYKDMIIRVQHFIESNYANDRLSLQDAAEHVRVSPSYLSKTFSQETGQTFIEFLTQTRMKKAMELLQTTRDKSYEIAYQVGYNDAHYFSNLFKKMTGITPKEFRRQGRPGYRKTEGDGR